MLLELARRHGLRGDTALDVALRNRQELHAPARARLEGDRLRHLASMVELARAKVGGKVRIEVADMRELPVYGSFDLVCCLDDAVNYLHSAARAGAGAARRWRPTWRRRVLIFDSTR